MTYTITNTTSGADLGAYEGDTPLDAYRAMMADAGYRTADDAASAGYSLDEIPVDVCVEMAGDCIQVKRSDDGTYEIPGAAEPEQWADVQDAAESVERIEDLAGWGGYTAAYTVDHGGWTSVYFVAEEDEAPTLREQITGTYDGENLAELTHPVAWSGTVDAETRREQEAERAELVDEIRDALADPDVAAVQVERGEIVGYVAA